MNNNVERHPYQQANSDAAVTLNQYIASTFGWMFLGLLVTFGLGFLLSQSWNFAYFIVFNPAVLFVMLAAELIVVIVLSARIHRMSVGAARGLFVLYALLNGLTFSVFFVAYGVTRLVLIFGLTAVFFGGFALYGRFTRSDLSGLRPLLFGGLIFLLLSGVLLMFIPMETFERVVCLVGVAVFLCFTAYDTQKIRANYIYYSYDGELLEKASVFSALELYLDFINLFLYLLRLFARNRK